MKLDKEKPQGRKQPTQKTKATEEENVLVPSILVSFKIQGFKYKIRKILISAQTKGSKSEQNIHRTFEP